MMVREMTPPRWLRFLPGASRWHLWAVLRFHIVESMMRRHITECSFEQMMLPVHTVSVDLISGRIVVRERGDAIAAVHESLNVPGISRPILRGGQALVDGGVLDNLPASVLRDRRAQFVVGVNISSKLLHKFGANDPTTPTARMRQAGLLETMMRIIEVQQHGLASVGVSASDFLVEPDTSRFAFDDFSRGEEMAEVGQAAAEETIPRLRQMLVELGINP
jgi:predicted acylesterase/phospholipase RssA